MKPAMPNIEQIPAAPFADRGTGTQAYTTDDALRKDVDLARRVLNDPRWPVRPELRAKVIEWLEQVMCTATDDRAIVNAAKAIIGADKLNLDQAKLIIECEKVERKSAESGPVTVNISTGDTHVSNTIINRIDQLAAAFEGAADRSGPGTVPSDGSRKPVDS